MWFESLAWAADGGAQAAPAGGGFLSMLLPIALMFGIMWLLIIRPQQKKAKEHQAMLNALQRGDEVVTSGGIYGKVVGLAESAISLEIANNVKIRVARSHIAGKRGAEGAEANPS